MRLNINISPGAERKLRKRAAAHGKELGAYASEIIEEAAKKQTLDELLEPLRKEFEASGSTDEQLLDQITTAQRARRKSR